MRRDVRRERLLARRNFQDPAFVEAVLRLVERRLSEAKGRRGLWRLYDTVKKRAANGVDLLAIPDYDFPERGVVGGAVVRILPLRTAADKSAWLTALLRDLAAHYTSRGKPVEARMFETLAAKVAGL